MKQSRLRINKPIDPMQSNEQQNLVQVLGLAVPATRKPKGIVEPSSIDSELGHNSSEFFEAIEWTFSQSYR